MTNDTPLTDEQRGLAERHVNLAWSIVESKAWKYPRRRDEIESAAMYGLLKAARSFDPGAGVEFCRLAGKTIRGQIKDCRREWQPKGFKNQTDHDLLPKVLSFDELTDGAIDMPVDPDETFEHMIRMLPEKLKFVLRRYYLDGKTLSEIAVESGVSTSCVCQRHKSAIGRISPDGDFSHAARRRNRLIA